MRRLILTFGLAAGLLGLGACSTLGQPVTLSLADLTTRCDHRGGTLTPTGAETGRAQSDYICREPGVLTPGQGNDARVALNRAVDRSIRRGA